MQVISVFSGIGGFEIAAEQVGWDVVVSCEINDFGHKVLSYYWPNAYHHRNIKDLTREAIIKNSRWNPNEPTIVCGGFPCQGQSMAGKRKGREDERWLWPEMRRIIREVQPCYVVAENVPGIISIEGGVVFEQVQTDLEVEGYEVQTYILPACGINAPHRRDRVWFIAHAINSGHWNNGREGGEKNRIQGECGAALCAGVFDGTDTRIITDPESMGRGRRGSESVGRNGIENDLRERFCNNKGYGESGSASNPTCIQNNGRGSGRFQSEPPGVDAERVTSHSRLLRPEIGQLDTMGAEQLCKESDVADTQGTEQESTMRTRDGREGFTDCNSQCNTTDTNQPINERPVTEGATRSGRFVVQQTGFDGFPTQPPVRGRNDGVPGGLAGITVSKHRNESIKAYGNAIVPQVVFQIFKAIQDYDAMTP